MSERRPEDRDIAGFIVSCGGMWPAFRHLLHRDGPRALTSTTFWGLLVFSAFASVYAAVLVVGIALALCYFVYLAFAPGVSLQGHRGGLITVTAVLVLCFGFWWLDR